MVCFIHRPEYYKIFEDEKGNDLRGLAEIIVAKHRNGATGDVRLRFKSEFAKFMNLDEDLATTEYASSMNQIDHMGEENENSPFAPNEDFLSVQSESPYPF